MLYDCYSRNINYLRVSVTDRCNHRCRYCMPADGVALKRHDEILSLEEILEVVEYAVGQGFQKIRLTGGEPLVRKNIEFLVGEIAGLPGMRDFGMTTNGTLLAGRAHELKELGLHRVNVSLASLNADRYREITRGGELNEALEGIWAARDAGLTPIKLNVVVIPGVNDDERDAFLEFGRENEIEVRFIPEMDLARGYSAGPDDIGQCDRCNRLRLTSDGFLKPCLFDERCVNVRELGMERAFAAALENKPRAGAKNNKEMMYQIGG